MGTNTLSHNWKLLTLMLRIFKYWQYDFSLKDHLVYNKEKEEEEEMSKKNICVSYIFNEVIKPVEIVFVCYYYFHHTIWLKLKHTMFSISIEWNNIKNTFSSNVLEFEHDSFRLLRSEQYSVNTSFFCFCQIITMRTELCKCHLKGKNNKNMPTVSRMRAKVSLE